MGAYNNDESAYSSAPGIPTQNPPIPAQTSMPGMPQPVGATNPPPLSAAPPTYQPPQVEAPTYQPPVYPQAKPKDVPGPEIPKQQTDDKLTEAIAGQVFPGSAGGPGRFANPYSTDMKMTTFTGGGYAGGGYQPPQWEGRRGRMAQYSQYVKKNPFRGQE